jgi:hypothetical protein
MPALVSLYALYPILAAVGALAGAAHFLLLHR